MDTAALTRSHPAEPFDPPPVTCCRRQRLTEFAARLSRTIALARGLVRGGRHLDMTGIDDGVGMLCAQTLDLAPEDASAMVPVLQTVLAQLDLLAAALHRPGVPC